MIFTYQWKVMTPQLFWLQSEGLQLDPLRELATLNPVGDGIESMVLSGFGLPYTIFHKLAIARMVILLGEE